MRTPDLFLDGLAALCNNGYQAAVPLLRRALDAFGTDLGPAPAAILSVSDGQISGSTVQTHTPGIHHVTARAGRLVGTALLDVTNGHQA